MSKPSKNSSFRGNFLPIAMIGAALLLQAGAALAESDGEAIYRFYCYQCHGYAGDAQTLTQGVGFEGQLEKFKAPARCRDGPLFSCA